MSGINPPQQERSRRTYEQLLVAGSRLLADRSFDDVTVQDIVAEAGSSAGAFYGRFDDKSAFLSALQRRMNEAAERDMKKLEAVDAGSMSVDAVCEFMAKALVQIHIQNRGLIRALLTEATAEPELTKRAADLLLSSAAALGRLVHAPGFTFEEICEEIATGQRTCMAILDQGLFYGEIIRTATDASGMGADGDFSRLARIIRASMNL